MSLSPSSTGSSKRGGSSVRAALGIAYGQRGWNRQPVGGAIRLGGSPLAWSSGAPHVADPVEPVGVGRATR